MSFEFLSDPRYHLWAAFWMTIKLTLLSAVGSLVWGTVLAAMRVGPIPLMRAFAAGYVNVVRNTPLTVLIVASSVVLADTLRVELSKDINTNAFYLAVLGFVAYTATYVCETLRAGINTVPPGQAEAARAIGLTFSQNLRIIVLPQAFRAMIAPLASVLIALTKNTTVAASIGVGEAALLMSEMVENEGNALMSVFAIFALGFVVLTLPVGLLLGRLAKRLAVPR